MFSCFYEDFEGLQNQSRDIQHLGVGLMIALRRYPKILPRKMAAATDQLTGGKLLERLGVPWGGYLARNLSKTTTEDLIKGPEDLIKGLDQLLKKI